MDIQDDDYYENFLENYTKKHPKLTKKKEKKVDVEILCKACQRNVKEARMHRHIASKLHCKNEKKMNNIA